MKISEIITESSEQILTEASKILRDLPGAPVNFKLLNPDNINFKLTRDAGYKESPKYLYFNYTNEKWYYREDQGMFNRAFRAVNPFSDNTYFGSTSSDPGNTEVTDDNIKKQLNAKYADWIEKAKNPPEVTDYGSDNERYYYDMASNLWYNEDTDKKASISMQMELFGKYGRDRRGYPLRGTVDPRDTRELSQAKTKGKLKEFTRAEIDVWRKYAQSLKVKPESTSEERKLKLREYITALNLIAEKARANININPLKAFFAPEEIITTRERRDPRGYRELNDPMTDAHEKLFKGSWRAGGPFKPNSDASTQAVPITAAQIAQADARMKAEFDKAKAFRTTPPDDATIDAVSKQINGYANDIYLLLNSANYDPATVKTTLGAKLMAHVTDLGRELVTYISSPTPKQPIQLRGMAMPLSEISYMINALDPAVYADVKTKIFDELQTLISTNPAMAGYPDEVTKFQEMIKAYADKVKPTP